jgi:glycosyltransferase involved in cell wall biosynthesis
MKHPSAEPGGVMHVVPALFDSRDGVVGGAERYVLELARHMSEVVPTRLVTFGDRSRSERTGSLDVRVIGQPWFVRGQRSNPVSRSLLGEVRRAEVVHCHQQHVAASSLCAAWGRLIGRKVFCTDLGGGGWDVSAYVSTDRWYSGHLHISEYSRRVSGHNGVRRARVVFGGVDTDRFCPASNVSRDGTIVFVGRLLPHKGINDLLDALEPGMRAEIIGTVADDRHVADLKARASGKDVRFRPNCDDASVIDSYRRATCVVLPSVYVDMYGHQTRVPELLGQTLLEGMACGAPAVCTDVASLPEVVEHGTTGRVVPPNDPPALREALRWMLANPEEAAAMGTRARARVIERFSWSTVVDRCLEAYAA